MKQDRKARWLADLEFVVTKARPELTGKMDWNTAIFLFKSGLGVMEAAQKYVASQIRSGAITP